jgi:hypothetical protein
MVVLKTDINVSEECAASIFRINPEDKGSMLLQNVCPHLPSYIVSHSLTKTVTLMYPPLKTSYIRGVSVQYSNKGNN